MEQKNQVWIVMGSDSDLKVMSEAAQILDQFRVSYKISVASAHRSTDYALEQARTAASSGIKVIIAGAGLAAHLPGVLAAATTLPVIGVPLQSGPLAGQDALYAIVQMPPGIPVATVGINAARNAGLLALQILAIQDEELAKILTEYRLNMQKEVIAKDTKLQELGYVDYLKEKK